MGNTYRLVELNAGHWEQQRKLSNTNQIYDTLTALHNQGKQLTLCKVPAHIWIRGNKEANKVEKQAIDMPGMTTTRLLPDH